MASKRMFSLTVVDSDAFLDMPLSTQALYFHLCMRADDDGFVNNPKKIQRVVRATEDDLRVLMTKQFVIPFESGVLVIKHWKVHNVIRKDMHKDTLCTEEQALLIEDKSGTYHVRNELVTDTVQECIEADTDTKSDGRGFYLCPKRECADLAIKRKAFNRVLRMNVDAESIEKAISQVIGD